MLCKAIETVKILNIPAKQLLGKTNFVFAEVFFSANIAHFTCHYLHLMLVRVRPDTEYRQVFAPVFYVKHAELISNGVSHFTRPVKAVTVEITSRNICSLTDIREKQF